MKSSVEKSYKCYMTHPLPDIPDEMKRSPKYHANTGGPACAHGSLTTSQDAQYASRTKMSCIESAPHYTASLLQKTHSPLNKLHWTLSLAYPQMDPTTPY